MLDMESALPLYAQVKALLVRRIRAGQYPPHFMLPAERELVEQLGVSRITVRRALNDLADEGLVYRKVGRGTYVAAEPIVETVTELVGHLEELQRRNLNPQVTMVEQGLRVAPAEAGMALGAPPGVFFARRVIAVEGAPLLVLDLCLPADLGLNWEGFALADVPVHALLERYGLMPHSAEQRVGARAAQGWEAELLGVDAGAPVLEVVRTEWTGIGGGLLWSRAVYRGDRYSYVFRLHRRRSRG